MVIGVEADLTTAANEATDNNKVDKSFILYSILYIMQWKEKRKEGKDQKKRSRRMNKDNEGQYFKPHRNSERKELDKMELAYKQKNK